MLFGIGFEQGFVFRSVRDFGVEPRRKIAWLKCHRHTVMDGGNHCIRLSDQDRAGIDSLSGSVLQLFIQSCKDEQLGFFWIDAIGSLPILSRLPFEKPAGRYQAATLFEGRPEGGF